MLASLINDEINPSSERPLKSRLHLQELLNDIRLHPNRTWTVEQMAQRINVSARTLNRTFLDQFGITPIDMVIRERMAAAQDMLTDKNTKVTEVAHNLGYESITSFCRLFKKHTGKASSQCRGDHGAINTI